MSGVDVSRGTTARLQTYTHGVSHAVAVEAIDPTITVMVGRREICDCFQNGKPISDEDRANARRLAAAWNVIEGISTEEAERMAEVGHFARLGALERERDDVGRAARELLNTMERSVGRSSAYHDIAEALRTLRAQLDKVRL